MICIYSDVTGEMAERLPSKPCCSSERPGFREDAQSPENGAPPELGWSAMGQV